MGTIWSSQFGSTRQDVVHHTLAFGTADECKKLIKGYGINTVKSDFLTPKRGLYSRQAFGFAQLILGIEVDPKNYVKSLY